MFHLKQTIDANMASFMQEQLFDISSVYQLLQCTKFEDHSTLRRLIVKDICEKLQTWPTPMHMVITPPPPHALHPSGAP